MALQPGMALRLGYVEQLRDTEIGQRMYDLAERLSVGLLRSPPIYSLILPSALKSHFDLVCFMSSIKGYGPYTCGLGIQGTMNHDI